MSLEEGRAWRRALPSGVLLGAAFLFGLSVLTAETFARLGVAFVWDDAFITQRYAEQFLKTGALAWNPGERPSYGVTGPLWLMVVIPVRAVIGNPALAATLSSLLAGGVATVALWVLVVRALPTFPSRRLAAASAQALVLAGSAPAVASHLVSGMDTMFAVSCLSGYLLLLARSVETGDNALVCGLAGGLMQVARPDLMIFTTIAPIVMLLTERRHDTRAQVKRVLGMTLITLAVLLLCARLYFGTALPLAMQAKSPGHYGAAFDSVYAGIAAAQLRAFIKSYSCVLLLCAGLLLPPTEGAARLSAFDRGVIAGLVGFIAYHLFLVVPVMYFEQRFFYPALPALWWLAARGAARALEWPRQAGSAVFRARAMLLGAVLVLCVQLTLAIASRREPLPPSLKRIAPGAYDLGRHIAAGGAAIVWPGLAVVTRLPNDLHVAATEVGLLAAANPDKRITDLSGLTNPRLALGDTSASRILISTSPDLVYLPHADYADMTREIESDPELKSRYEWRKNSPRPFLGVAILRGGKYASTLESALSDATGSQPQERMR